MPKTTCWRWRVAGCGYQGARPAAPGACDRRARRPVVDLAITDTGVEITATVRTADRTASKWKALTAVAVAALAVVDMVKGVQSFRGDHAMSHHGQGGRSGDWVRDQPWAGCRSHGSCPSCMVALIVRRGVEKGLVRMDLSAARAPVRENLFARLRNARRRAAFRHGGCRRPRPVTMHGNGFATAQSSATPTWCCIRPIQGQPYRNPYAIFRELLRRSEVCPPRTRVGARQRHAELARRRGRIRAPTERPVRSLQDRRIPQGAGHCRIA
ncbi:MAG: cyclic pyranopterin monophosphate synthase MoaC [Micropruina glycogenica]